MGARLAHRLVGVGGCDDPRGPRDRVGREAARVAGAVEALALLDGDAAERGERLGLVEHALGHVGMHAHALPLAGAERAGLVPDRVRHAEATEVVHEAGAAHGADLALAERQLRRGLRGQAAMARECPSV